MDATIAARIVALRPCIEALLVRTCLSPESVGSPSGKDACLIEILRQLSSPYAWRSANQGDTGASEVAPRADLPSNELRNERC